MKPIIAAGLVLGLLISNAAFAQGGGAPPPSKRIYDPATVATVSGKIVTLDTIVHKQGGGAGLHASLQVGGGGAAVDVHLGPVWYWKTLTTKLQVGDEVSVTGSKVTIDGKAVLIGAEVKRGADVLTLRDASGRPVWAGQKGR